MTIHTGLTGLKAGDTIYVRNIDRRDPQGLRACTITKVGRVYASTDNHTRYRIDSGLQDCGQYMAQTIAYRSEAECAAILEADRAWRDLIGRIGMMSRPKHLDADAIKAIAVSLQAP